MTPMEDAIMLQIKKGLYNPIKIGQKLGKASNYIATYGKIMVQKELINNICPTCQSKSYYKEIINK